MVILGLFHSTIRTEEKLIIQAAYKRGLGIKVVDIRTEIFNPLTYKINFDLALQRSVSAVKGLYATKFLESLNIPVVNSSLTTGLCDDKFFTSLILSKFHVPTLKFALVFNIKQAIQTVTKLGGFPIVIKPPHGSWGRLLAKVNDQDCLEAIIEHKEVLGSPQQKVFYLQEYVKKPGRDIRAFVIDGKVICAIYRNSNHWITNTALGGKVTNCKVTHELKQICQKSSEAVGGGILAMDIFETKEGLKVNEINHTMEFKNSEIPTGVSISGAIIDFCLKSYRQL